MGLQFESLAGGGGGGGAPTNAQYIVAALNGGLSAERLLTDTASVTWDFSTPGQAKATAAGGVGSSSDTELLFNNAGVVDGFGSWDGSKLWLGIDQSAGDCTSAVIIGPHNAFVDLLLSENCGPLIIGGGPDVTGSVTLYGIGDDAQFGGIIQTFVRARGTPAAPTKTLNGDYLGGFEFEGFVEDTNHTADVGRIQVFATADYDVAGPLITSKVQFTFDSYEWNPNLAGVKMTLAGNGDFALSARAGTGNQYAYFDASGNVLRSSLPIFGALQTYTESNVTTDRTYDANSTSLDEVADVLGTLLGDLRAKGIVA